MRDIIETTVQASRALAAAGLTDMVWGHAAIRDPDGRGVWMKAAGGGFQLMALAAGGPKVWSSPAEAALKRDQVWNAEQRHAGWEYLLRVAERNQ